MFRRRSKKTSEIRVTGLCEGNLLATGGFPSQMASNAGNVSIDDAIMGLIVISFCRWRTATYDTREIYSSSAKFSLYHRCVFFDMHRALIIIIQELYGNANQNTNKSYTVESSRAHSAHYNFSYFYGDKFMCGIQFLSYKVSKVFFAFASLQHWFTCYKRLQWGIEPGYIHESCRAAVKLTIAWYYCWRNYCNDIVIKNIEVHPLPYIGSYKYVWTQILPKKWHTCQGNCHYDWNPYNCSLDYFFFNMSAHENPANRNHGCA